MYIREIHIENIRGFGQDDRGVHLDLMRPNGSLAGWTVVAGVNGAGKTTLLRAIALSVSALPTALKLVENEGWVRAGAKSGYAKALVVRSVGDEFVQLRNESPAPEVSEFWTGLQWQEETEPALEAMVALNPKKQRNPPLRGPCAERPDGWFIAGYGPFRRLTGAALDAERLMKSSNRVGRLVSLFREDASLVECVRWLQDIDYRSKESGKGAPKAKQLEQDVFRLLDDRLLPGHAKIDRVDSDGLWVIRDGVELLHTQLSDGYKTVTALVLDIAKNIFECFGSLGLEEGNGIPVVRRHGVVLIDEIDAHLHVSWQKQIGFWLKRHFPNIQFIVTTHSPYICQAADPHGLIRLAIQGDPRPTGFVSDDVYDTVVNGTADDATMSELFGVERPYSDEAELLRAQITELESRVIQGEATAKERAALEKLSARLPKTPSAAVERALLNLSARIGPKSKSKRQ